eukprot:4330261-Amphidinium_carterae.1
MSGPCSCQQAAQAADQGQAGSHPGDGWLKAVAGQIIWMCHEVRDAHAVWCAAETRFRSAIAHGACRWTVEPISDAPTNAVQNHFGSSPLGLEKFAAVLAQEALPLVFRSIPVLLSLSVTTSLMAWNNPEKLEEIKKSLEMMKSLGLTLVPSGAQRRPEGRRPAQTP